MSSSRAQARIHDAALQLFAEKGAEDLSVTELAKAAGIARGTIYNNIESPESLFEDLAGELATEMHRRVVESYAAVEDPVERLAHGMRFHIRRAHDEPAWGRFITRFAFSHAPLEAMWTGPPMRDVLTGMALGRYDFSEDRIPAVLAMIGGTVVATMVLVVDGHRSWRDAGADSVELVLRAMGIDPKEARAIACTDLPPLLEVQVSAPEEA